MKKYYVPFILLWALLLSVTGCSSSHTDTVDVIASTAAESEAERQTIPETTAMAPETTAIALETTAEEIRIEDQVTRTMYASESVNVRSNPDSGSDLLGTYDRNESIDVISTDGSWTKIAYNGAEGYVYSQYLSETKLPDEPQTTPPTEPAREENLPETAPSDEGGSSSDVMVWIPRTGERYHANSSCSIMKNPTQVTLEEAQSQGYTPCKKCYH